MVDRRDFIKGISLSGILAMAGVSPVVAAETLKAKTVYDSMLFPKFFDEKLVFMMKAKHANNMMEGDDIRFTINKYNVDEQGVDFNEFKDKLNEYIDRDSYAGKTCNYIDIIRAANAVAKNSMRSVGNMLVIQDDTALIYYVGYSKFDTPVTIVENDNGETKYVFNENSKNYFIEMTIDRENVLSIISSKLNVYFDYIVVDGKVMYENDTKFSSWKKQGVNI